MKPGQPQLKGLIRPAKGIKEALRTKARGRRDRNRALVEIADHTPGLRNDLLPQLTIVNVNLTRLTNGARRVRVARPEQVERIKTSICKFGVCQPTLVDSAYRIVHGHSVVEAARALGLSELPVIVVDHLEPAELRLLSIALNRLGETGTWDEPALKIEIEELINLGEDVVLSGFDEAEIDFLLLDDGDVDAGEADLPEIEGSPISAEGDLWQLGRHRLLVGDARVPLSYARLFDGDPLARIVLTDEPYNVPILGHVTSQARHREFAVAAGEMTRDEFAAFNRDWMALASERLMNGGMLATFIDWRGVEPVLGAGRGLGLELLNIIVWAKTNAGQGSLWRSQHELLPVFKKGGSQHVNNIELGRFGRSRSNVWEYPGASSLGSEARDGLAIHPTVKPRALLEDALLDVTNLDEIVLDPFAGSGSTLLAAERTRRICRTIEIDPQFCDLVIRRWQAMAGESATLAASGEPFAEIEERRSQLAACL